MKISIDWLKELVSLKIPIDELVRILPLRTIGLKEITKDYIELDMKGYNRADLLSMRGVAYEISAITNSQITFRENSDYVWQNLELPKIETQVKDSNLAPVYCLAKIEGLKVENSPSDWIKKLTESGMRSVNNIADVANMIMLEYGQPLHAFDAEKLKGSVKVRVAKKGEKITTLDGKVRNLIEEDLLIADDAGAVAIAGVMGGQNSEVTASTTIVLLEAAVFDSIHIRQTASRLNLQSEASKRFQHGLTKQRLLQALDAAIKMYESLGGKLTGITLAGNLGDELRTITLTQEKINSLIGIEIPAEQVEKSLKSLGFQLKREGANVDHLEGGLAWHVISPYWRLDVNIEEDVIEEVARMYGYEKIPPKELAGQTPQKIDQSFFEFIYKLKTTLSKVGLTEVQTYSFYSTQVLNNLDWDKNKLIKIANPISSETEYLRDSLWPNLLETTAKNIRNGIKDVAIFELGKVYRPKKGGLPEEPYHLAIALSNGTDNPIDELLVIARNVVTKQSSSDTNSIKIATGREGNPRNDGSTNKDVFHPTRFTTLGKDGKQVGTIAEVHPRIVNKFGTEQRVAVLEIELDSSLRSE